MAVILQNSPQLRLLTSADASERLKIFIIFVLFVRSASESCCCRLLWNAIKRESARA